MHYIFTGVNHPTSVNYTFCDDEYSNPSDRASPISQGVIKGVIFSPNYDNGDISDLEKCELSITTNINENRNSFTTLKLLPKNDISGDICLLEMISVSGYDRIVNGDCKEVNVTTSGTDNTLKLGKQLQSKPSFHITYKGRVCITQKFWSVSGWKTNCLEKSGEIVAYHYIKEFKLRPCL